MNKGSWALMIVLLASLMTASVRADSWMLPQPKTYTSAGGGWRLIVFPREITSPLNYFQDQVDKRANAGGVKGNPQSAAIGRMEKRVEGSWQIVWETALVNDVAPVEALALEGGQAITLDNWHSMGYGDNAVTIYDSNGILLDKFALSDFLPEEYFNSLPRTVSSIHWRDHPRISVDRRQLIIPVVVPTIEREDLLVSEQASFIEIRFDLATGNHIRDEGEAWQAALKSARLANARLVADAAEARKKFVSPLVAPTTNEEPDWHQYLVEAYFRLDPDWVEGYPSTTVLRLPSEPDYQQSVVWVREVLTEEIDRENTIMLASPSQNVLLEVLKKEAARVRRGALASMRMYIALDDVHFHLARKILAHTGASILQIDIDQPIPQRQERLDRYLSRGSNGRD